ncbi:MAG TPA: hypothetical protein VMK12_10710 [Anaeromyxobacteraceae bacterium]|nr:hypothetical protein [Anaeromyxobacteraceae bacterium]
MLALFFAGTGVIGVLKAMAPWQASLDGGRWIDFLAGFVLDRMAAQRPEFRAKLEGSREAHP